jgi:Rrf2 family protein
MNITSKSRYALKIMMDLALHASFSHTHRQDIVRRQGIPPDYLDQIMMRLRRGELIESIRGRGGGYRLARPAHQISVWDIFSVVEDSMIPAQCVEGQHTCDFEVACMTRDAWQTIYQSIRSNLQKMSLAQLLTDDMAMHKLCPAAGTRLCVGGGQQTNLRS